MLDELFEKTKILRVVQEYLEESVNITSDMDKAKTMEEMRAHVERLNVVNEKLLNYLQGEVVTLAEKAVTEDPMSLLGVVRQTGGEDETSCRS